MDARATRELAEVMAEIIVRAKGHLNRARRPWFGRFLHLGRAEGMSEAVEMLQDLLERWVGEEDG